MMAGTKTALYKRRIRDFILQYKESKLGIVGLLILVLFIFLAIAVLGEIVFLFLPSSPSNTQEYLFLILEAVACALAYLLVRLQLPVQISEITKNKIDRPN